jgi:hypothetical protein
MKKLAVIIQVIGLILLVVLILGGFSKYVHGDKQFLLLLFIGLGVTMIGFLIETYLYTPITTMQMRNKRKQIRFLVYGTIGLIGCIILTYFV